MFVSFESCCSTAGSLEVHSSNISVVDCCSLACFIVSSNPMGRSLLCAVLEDLLGARGCEFGRQGRCLLPAPFAVVVAPHGVGPPVAVSGLEPNPVLLEHLLERRAVDAAWVGQGLVDQVTKVYSKPPGLNSSRRSSQSSFGRCGSALGSYPALTSNSSLSWRRPLVQLVSRLRAFPVQSSWLMT